MPKDVASSDSFLHALPEPALLLDTRTDCIPTLNRAAAELLMLPFASTGTATRFTPLLDKALPAFLVFLQEVEHRGEGWTRDVPLRAADGTRRRVELRARFLPDAPHIVLIMMLDLDELDHRNELAEAAGLQRAGLDSWKTAVGFFAELERQNQLILNAAGEGIYGVNAEGKTTFVNRAAQEMLGWSAEDLLGHDIHSKIHHHHLDGEVYHAHDCHIYRSFRFEQTARVEDEVFWRKDGKPIRVEYVSTPIYDQKVLAGAVVIFRDITERKENEEKLRAALKEVADLRDRLEQENTYLQEAISSERAHLDIIGDTPEIREILSRIDLVAETDTTVFITGETGTGKALVATAIHKASSRSRRPLIHFKCGSVAPEAVEAEVFGQIRGATPGAVRDKPGKLELAHGGTLFLDDVEELPIELQGKLLQVLQSGKVTRMGDTRPKDIEIRLIAASTVPPERALKTGMLREDLLLHLNVFPISCPPLRHRLGDIPQLAMHLLTLACRRLNRPVPNITEHSVRQLQSYDWPGNVRELRNVIERAVIVSKGSKLIIELAGNEDGAQTSDTVKTEAEMQRLIRSNLVAAMRVANGRVSGPSGVANLLGLRPTTVYSRLKSFGVDKGDWE